MPRRLAAILAADMVGYSRLMGQDEAGTQRALGQLRDQAILPLIEHHSGRVFTRAGDGFLAAFASTTDAVQCAFAIQQQIHERTNDGPNGSRLAMRIGVNTGEVMEDGADVFGDCVNIAKRLEELANPGGINLSESVYRQVRNRIDAPFQPIGERVLKNIVDPVSVWRWERPEAGAEPQSSAAPAGYAFTGQQVLDPRVTDLILQLHMRSARLAVSNAFDRLADRLDAGEQLAEPQVYETLGEEVNQARVLLACVLVERAEDHTAYLADGARHQTLSDFFQSLTDSNRTAYTMHLIPEITRILKSDAPLTSRRRSFMDLIDRFILDQYLPRARKVLKYAFTER